MPTQAGPTGEDSSIAIVCLTLLSLQVHAKQLQNQASALTPRTRDAFCGALAARNPGMLRKKAFPSVVGFRAHTEELHGETVQIVMAQIGDASASKGESEHEQQSGMLLCMIPCHCIPLTPAFRASSHQFPSPPNARGCAICSG